MNDRRLNPCARCLQRHGNEGVLTLFHSTDCDEDNDGGYYPAYVSCSQCRQYVAGERTDESAIEAWNKENLKESKK